jgi:tripartite-type tricarboxylate transporter receptor subunit TctC
VLKFFLGLIVSLLAPLAEAQQWPSKPVRVMVNVAPGGVADVTMRVLGARLGETLGQPFIVENRAGGDGYIGFEAVARSEADGYTLVYSPGSSMMIAPHIVKRADLDPIKALTPVAATGRVSLYVLVHPNLPTSNFAEFLAYARANPGKLNYGTPGNGTSPHIATEVFNREANVKMNHVPYKGAGPALQDLLGGVIDLAFDPGVGIGQAKAGKLRMVAIAGPQRHPDFPNVPTLEENGIKGVDGGPHFGFYAPSGTPREVVARINAEVRKAMEEPAVRDRFKALAVDLAEPMTPERFAAYVRAEHERYARLLPELRIGQ